MDPQKIGAFICSLRKKNKMTQSEFAQKLMVTSQAVSKWENGRGIPDIEILKQISEVFQVDLETLLNGEEKKKRKRFPFWIGILIISIFALFLFLAFFFFRNDGGFSFSDLTSSNSSFSVRGVAAYSDEQSSIYISDIVYLDDDVEGDYFSIECVLYEEDGNVQRKIGESLIESETAKSLNDLLHNIEFHIDSFEISCNNLSESVLYISIQAKNKNNKIETYIVPLELTSCMVH